jgi:hypothetical protein
MSETKRDEFGYQYWATSPHANRGLAELMNCDQCLVSWLGRTGATPNDACRRLALHRYF